MTPSCVAATPIAARRRNARRRRSPSLSIWLSPNGVDHAAGARRATLSSLPPGQVRKRHLITVIRPNGLVEPGSSGGGEQVAERAPHCLKAASSWLHRAKPTQAGQKSESSGDSAPD